MVLSHNHPGGNLSASQADIDLTKTLVDLFTVLSIKVVDHVIVCGNRFSSMKSKGQFVNPVKYMVRETDDEDLNGDWDFE